MRTKNCMEPYKMLYIFILRRENALFEDCGCHGADRVGVLRRSRAGPGSDLRMATRLFKR